jgi:hypothetical protein
MKSFTPFVNSQMVLQDRQCRECFTTDKTGTGFVSYSICTVLWIYAGFSKRQTSTLPTEISYYYPIISADKMPSSTVWKQRVFNYPFYFPSLHFYLKKSLIDSNVDSFARQEILHRALLFFSYIHHCTRQQPARIHLQASVVGVWILFMKLYSPYGVYYTWRCITFLVDEAWKSSLLCPVLGCYSQTGFHIVMDGNFVCLWRRHNCNWSLPFCADLLIYEINYWGFKLF